MAKFNNGIYDSTLECYATYLIISFAFLFSVFILLLFQYLSNRFPSFFDSNDEGIVIQIKGLYYTWLIAIYGIDVYFTIQGIVQNVVIFTSLSNLFILAIIFVFVVVIIIIKAIKLYSRLKKNKILKNKAQSIYKKIVTIFKYYLIISLSLISILLFFFFNLNWYK